ncbi:MAG: hypothetical protein U1E23_11665 [Reyranellaceae bacterium]
MDHRSSRGRPRSEKFVEKMVSVGCGVVFVWAILGLAVAIPHPTPSQVQTFTVVSALAAAGFVSMVPGFLVVEVTASIRAGGALAAFLVVYVFSPTLVP